MNNYQRLEINLLPPEMAPSPAVRGSVILSWIVAVIAVLFIGVDAFIQWSAIASLKKQVKKQEELILQAKGTEDEYNSLKEIADNTEGRGKLVGLTTASYIDYPVVMDRVARLLPDGVYLLRAGSAGTSKTSPEMNLEFRTSSGDPVLVQRTLEAFKTSGMFSWAVLRSADFQPQALEELKKSFGLDYNYDIPELHNAPNLPSYDFELRVAINNPTEVDDLQVVMDNSDYMTQFTLATDPNAPAEKVAPGKAGAAPAGAPPADGAPATPAADQAPAGGGK